MPLAHTYFETNSVQCSGPGTLISTTDGDLPVEWLAVGDLVITRDAGAQPIKWIRRTRVDYLELLANPQFWPIVIPENGLGPGQPNAALTLSPHHRILVDDGAVEFLFGHSEAFVAASHYLPVSMRHAPTAPFTYHHILMEDHHVILANGAWTESLLSSDAEVDGVSHGPQPTNRHVNAARPCLRKWEAVVLRENLDRVKYPRKRAA